MRSRVSSRTLFANLSYLSPRGPSRLHPSPPCTGGKTQRTGWHLGRARRPSSSPPAPRSLLACSGRAESSTWQEPCDGVYNTHGVKRVTRRRQGDGGKQRKVVCYPKNSRRGRMQKLFPAITSKKNLAVLICAGVHKKEEVVNDLYVSGSQKQSLYRHRFLPVQGCWLDKLLYTFNPKGFLSILRKKSKKRKKSPTRWIMNLID